jgi:DNA-binding IclR family transcriptional regulator
MAGSIQSVERAAAILRLLAGSERRLGLTDVASTLGLAKGTAHGILRTLQQEGFVEQGGSSGKYQLGAELLRLGNSYLDVHELRARALVWTDDLARASGESAYLGIPHQHGVLIVHHVFRPDDSRQVLEVGAMQPLHSTALGKVLAAYDPMAHREALEAEREAFTARTVTAAGDFEGALEVTRARGWAADVEKTWEGVASVAAPIHDRRRIPVGAVLQNLTTEIIATAVLVLFVLTEGMTTGLALNGLGILLVALLVVGIGLSLGGPTGYAINPVRDLGPRIVHSLLPLPNKGGSDWGYAWIPVVGPLIGDALAGGIYQLAFG